MKRLTVLLLVLVFCLTAMPFSGMADDKKPDKVSYYQYPQSQTLPAGSIWNPVITVDKKTGEVQKSFFKYPDSKTLPQGSIWNPLVTTTEKNKK